MQAVHKRSRPGVSQSVLDNHGGPPSIHSRQLNHSPSQHQIQADKISQYSGQVAGKKKNLILSSGPNS